MKHITLLASLALGLLSACTISADRMLRDEFDAPLALQDTWQRALAQTELCLRGDARHAVQNRVESNAAQVSVPMAFGNRHLVSVDIRALDAERSRVSVAMAGVNIWNKTALAAMRDAILLGIPTCRSYMPTSGTGDARRR